MTDDAPVPDELAARIAAALGEYPADDADPALIAARAADRLRAVLDLIAAGRGVREAGSGLNAASTELLVADALLTDAAARAAAGGDLDALLRALDADGLAARAAAIDERAI